MITSRENKWLKQFRAALRGTGPRDGEPIGVEGPKLVEEALRSGLEANAILVSEGGERDVQRILRAASESEAGIPQSCVLHTTDKLFETIAGTDAPQGVAALFRQRSWGFDDLLRGPDVSGANGANETHAGERVPLVIVLAEVQDPGNVGTILRSAEAFGATGAVACRGTADPWSPKALRASSGSALRLPLLRGMAIPVILAQLRIAKIKIYAASSAAAGDANVSAGGPRSEPDLRAPAAIFIGNEGSGVPDEVKRAADALISIPMAEPVESLNAGVAASLVLYDAARQRK